MNHLDELRVRLSVCDEQILECLLRRNRIVEDIMKYKESHGFLTLVNGIIWPRPQNCGFFYVKFIKF